MALRRCASGRTVKPAASPCRRAEGGPAVFSAPLLLPAVVTVRNECESSRGRGCFLIARSFMLCYHLDAEHEWSCALRRFDVYQIGSRHERGDSHKRLARWTHLCARGSLCPHARGCPCRRSRSPKNAPRGGALKEGAASGASNPAG